MGYSGLALLRNKSKVGMPVGNVSQTTSFEFMALRELGGNNQLTRSRSTAILFVNIASL
jgi:hypothetical protein